MGTAVLILLGDGAVATMLLRFSKGLGGGWMAITTGWGIAVFAGVVTAHAWGSPGANLNPAVTLAFAILSGDYRNLASFIPAQVLGAMTGSTLMWLAYLPHWGRTEDAATKHACFCTVPAIRHYASNFLAEFIGAGMLILLAAAIASHLGSPHGIPDGLGALLIGYVVWGIGLSLGGPTGYAINPARDFGPRLMYSLLPVAGKGGADWAYAWIPVFGPIAGAAAAAILIRACGAA